MNAKAKYAYLYEIVFFVYLLFLFINSYCFFTEIQYPFHATAFMPVGDWDKLWQIDFSRLNLLRDPLYFLGSIEIPNLIFNFLSFSIPDSLLAYNLTPTIVVIVCIFLVYKIGSLISNKAAGFIAAFIFSSFPITVIYSKYNIYHLGKTLYLLLAVYFYLKSDNLRQIRYSLLYLFSVIFVFWGEFGAIRSGSLYSAILVILNIYFFIKSNKSSQKMNIVYLWLAGGILLLVLKLAAPDFLKNYIYAKVPFWIFENHGWEHLGKYIFNLPYDLGQRFFYSFYFWAIMILCLLNFWLVREKNREASEIIINWLIIFPLVVQIVTFDRTVLEDIFPVFALLSLKIVLIVKKLINRPYAVLKLKQRFRKYIEKLALPGLVFLFFYGILLIIPEREGTLSAGIGKVLNLKRTLYISTEAKKLDAEFEAGQREIISYIKSYKRSGKKRVFMAYRDVDSLDFVGLHFANPLELAGFEYTIKLLETSTIHEADLKGFDYFIFLQYKDEKLITFKEITRQLNQTLGVKVSLEKEFNFKGYARQIKMYFTKFAVKEKKI